MPCIVNCCNSRDSDVLLRCLAEGPALELDEDTRSRVTAYVQELLAYNEHTNVYSKSAYMHLPFHVQDSLTLGMMIAEQGASGVLDLGSGSGLPSVLIACVNPQIPVFAIESKSRKTRFLSQAAQRCQLPYYLPITTNVHEFARHSCCDVDFVTAKAFKPLPEVSPIAALCVRQRALLSVPVSEAQVRDLQLNESKLLRCGKFIYFQEDVMAARGLSKRKVVTITKRIRA
eukprot:CAMPEP_0119314862 /NCGR_PEP_ID=MMETSP1333-20130426/34070_1 /TAXON_ID=418940 /ORGANISM="Scyphosphaera apsteinii, Strain RCC1455" /LENGTH=229 /DNA_ID=CAMNT_0007320061 /DNA_START=154 /DNA_END=843 /DNA_ORIENTATION=+